MAKLNKDNQQTKKKRVRKKVKGNGKTNKVKFQEMARTGQVNELRIQPSRTAKPKSSEDNIKTEIETFSKKYENYMESQMVLDTSDMFRQPLDREAVILTRITTYEEDVYKYLREAEMRNRAKAGYFEKQQDTSITPFQRNMLADWIVEISEELYLQRETLFLAINYIDRFLSKMPVSAERLQLVGAASLFLAAKYEEKEHWDVKDITHILDGMYTAEQVLCMERIILKVLTFNVGVPTTNVFCENFVKSCDGDGKLKDLSMFLCELTLIDTDTYLKYVPSITAAASLCLARYLLGLQPWTSDLAKKTGYEVEHFENCLTDLHKTYLGAETHQHQAVQEKYEQDKYRQVWDFINPVPNN